MDRLKQLIRVVLNEGALEQETTAVSRQIVDELKLRLSKTAGFVRAFKFKIPAPDSLEAKNIEVSVKRGRAKRIGHAVVSGSFHRDPENLPAAHVKILIEVPDEWSEFDAALRQFSSVVPDLKDILRHEFEHSTQTAEELDSTAKFKEGDLDSIIRYYLSPAEVKATVAGMYKAAKTRKMNLEDLFADRHFEVIRFSKQAGANEAEAREIGDKVFSAWKEYAHKRFPRARL